MWGMSKLILLFWMLTGAACAAQQTLVRYEQLQKQYQHFSENDEQALPLVRHSIAVAKRDRNYRHLIFAYEDAVFHSPAKDQKLRFADSAVAAGLLIKDKAWAGRAHLGRGVVWYFSFRNYRKALEDYLTAANNAEGSGDPYLIYRIKYQIGVVKSHLGYPQEALHYFKACDRFFQQNLKAATHPNYIFNYTRGHLNTAHQMSICYRRLGRWAQVDSLLQHTHFSRRDFPQEHGYFLKEYGIAAFHRGDYSLALDFLRPAAQLIRGKKDEGNLSTAYYYLGIGALKSADRPAARAYLHKVDSLFAVNHMVSPEVRAALEHLLRDTDIQQEPERAAYLIQQLLKADSILNRDLPYLSARIHREYDTVALQNEKNRLVQLHHLSRYVAVLCAATALILSVIVGYMHRRRRRTLLKQDLDTSASTARQHEYGDEVVMPILQKLQAFEQKDQYTDSSLTLARLAKKLGTNSHRLSYVLNEHRGVSFSTYLTQLRIAYIIRQLDTDPKYLNYTVKALALACGMRTRQHFSEVFLETTGLRPSDYVHQRKS